VTAVSFVIATLGARTSLLDELVLPAIFGQDLDEAEVILVGRYSGRHRDRVRVESAPVGGELFYKPFQHGAEAAAHPWIVDLDDDMLLAEDWGRRLRANPPHSGAVSGMAIVNPDGSSFGMHFDAVDNSRSGAPGPTSYFAASIAPADVYRNAPYPTYQSGDRAHALRMTERLPELGRVAREDLSVMHLGWSMQHPGLVPKTTMDQITATRPLQQFLRENDVAWTRFADRHLDGKPDVTLESAWEVARAAVGDPDLRSRHDWLL
jgi:hypothetical protein